LQRGHDLQEKERDVKASLKDRKDGSLAIGQAQRVHRPGEVHADELTASREKGEIEARRGSCVEVVLQHEVADVAACLLPPAPLSFLQLLFFFLSLSASIEKRGA
jgi:hypothetical protein